MNSESQPTSYRRQKPPTPCTTWCCPTGHPTDAFRNFVSNEVEDLVDRIAHHDFFLPYSLQLRHSSESEQPRNEAANLHSWREQKRRNDVDGAWGGGWRGLRRSGIANKMRHGGWVLPHATSIGNAARATAPVEVTPGTVARLSARDPN